MALTTEQTELLTTIQGKLKRGDISDISDSIGKSREYVSRVLSPFTELYNEDIVAEAVRIIEKRKQGTKKLLKIVNAA